LGSEGGFTGLSLTSGKIMANSALVGGSITVNLVHDSESGPLPVMGHFVTERVVPNGV
jgi:hypothetical protein